MKNKSLTPQIRFKGYEDEWVSRPFSEIVTRYSLLKYDETIPSVEYEDINSKKGTLNKDIFSKPIHKSGQYFQIGDILFGKLRPYLGNNLLANFDGIAVGDFWIFKNGLANTRFIYPFLYSKDYSYISNISSGSKMPRSDWGLVSSWNFNIPSSEEEQTLIGGLFANIDKSIFEAEREITRLEKMKQASLQKMFPRPGETTPEIRFRNFTEDWICEELISFVEIYGGLTYTPSDVQESGTLVLRSSNVKRGNIVNADNIYVNLKCVNVDNVREGDIIMVVRNGSVSLIGKHGQITSSMPHTVIGAFMTGFRAKYPSFVNALFDTILFSHEVNKNAGATINQITNGMLKQMKFYIPRDDKEQRAIGEYFRNLDAIISAKRKKLEKLQNLKQSCLDKMFVNTTAQ